MDGHHQREQGGAVAEADEATVRRAVTGAALGNAMEWFDFAVYSYLITSITAAIFPEFDPTVRLLSGFAVLAVPFVVRPFGGIVLGPLGDRFGRKRVLATTILLMSGSTVAIGLIPSYATIGVAAPILLVLARLVQGFSTGGEYGGAATFMAEYSPTRRRGFFGSFLEFGTLGGYVLGAGLATVFQLTLSEQDMVSWGWRIPFLLAAPLGLIGFYLRNRLDDTPAFQQCEQAGAVTSAPFKEVIANNWRQILNLMGIVVLLNVADYTLLTYMPTYLTQVLDIDATEALLLIIGVMVVLMLCMAPVGALSDRIGRKPLLITAAVGFLVLSYPAITVIGTGGVLGVAGGLLVLGLLLLCILATIGSTFPAMFATRNRYGVLRQGYSVSTALFGGTAPFVITALIASTGSTTVPAYYLMGAAVVAIIPILVMPETAQVPIHTHPTVVPGTNRRVPVTAR